MQPFSRPMGDCILYTMLNLSDAEMDAFVKNKFHDFAEKPYSDRELYDLLCQVGSLPIQHTLIDKVKFSTGPISAFVKAVCDISTYYARPEDGEKKLLDREFCKKELE